MIRIFEWLPLSSVEYVDILFIYLSVARFDDFFSGTIENSSRRS